MTRHADRKARENKPMMRNGVSLSLSLLPSCPFSSPSPFFFFFKKN
jgi:hypothetical protein